MSRTGLLFLGISALLLPASLVAQRTRAPSDSFAVVQAGSAMHVEWQPNVVREVPLLGAGEAPDESPDESPRDPFVFGIVTFTLLAVTVAASWVPARRAARVDPNVALRTD